MNGALGWVPIVRVVEEAIRLISGNDGAKIEPIGCCKRCEILVG